MFEFIKNLFSSKKPVKKPAEPAAIKSTVKGRTSSVPSTRSVKGRLEKLEYADPLYENPSNLTTLVAALSNEPETKEKHSKDFDCFSNPANNRNADDCHKDYGSKSSHFSSSFDSGHSSTNESSHSGNHDHSAHSHSSSDSCGSSGSYGSSD